MFDAAGLEILDRDECLRLLASVPVGRIVFTVGALPAIQPVYFLLYEGAVIIRTRVGSRLAAAADNAVVAFEADEFDAGAVRVGWSVVIIGQAMTVAAPADLAAVRRLPLRPWAPDSRERYLRITLDVISGRRVGHPAPAPGAASRTPEPRS